MRKRVGIALAVLLVVSIVGFGVSWFLNVFVFDEYDAYGEVPIPGTRTLHLPQGDVKVTFHTEIAGSMEGGSLPVPQDLEVERVGTAGGHPRHRGHGRRQPGCPRTGGSSARPRGR